MNLIASQAWDTFVRIFSGPIVGETIGWKEELIALLRIVIAAIIGVVMGIERRRRQKEAGIATHVIVATASALFTIISTSIVKKAGVDGERIAAAVVTGVGFLGAGIIFFRRESLRGLTTAAGIWATAAMGMCVAVGQMIVAFGMLVLILSLQLILHSKAFVQRDRKHMLFVKFVYSDDIKNKLVEHFAFDNFHRFKITTDGDKMIAEAVIYTKQNYYANELSQLMIDMPAILSIERLEDL